MDLIEIDDGVWVRASEIKSIIWKAFLDSKHEDSRYEVSLTEGRMIIISGTSTGVDKLIQQINNYAY